MQVSVIVVRALADELRRRGMKPDAVLGAVGLDPAILDDPTARISFDVHNALVGRALELTDDPQLGLYVGARAPVSALTVVGGLILSSGTLRDAGQLLLQYSSLIVEGSRWAITQEDKVVSLSCELADGFAHRAYEHEACLALTFNVIRPFGPDVPIEVCFKHPPTGPLDVYRKVFECDVKFGAEENAIRGSTWILDRRQPHTDMTLGAILRQRADVMLAELKSPDRLPSRIRSYVMTHEAPISVDTAELATEFGLSRRTLRRRLAEHGMSLRELVQDTVQSMARRGLEERSPSIKEIAYRLGFADVASFHRAFKRWTGLTPIDYRERAEERGPAKDATKTRAWRDRPTDGN